jgi:hypothetical protein
MEEYPQEQWAAIATAASISRRAWILAGQAKGGVAEFQRQHGNTGKYNQRFGQQG